MTPPGAVARAVARAADRLRVEAARQIDRYAAGPRRQRARFAELRAALHRREWAAAATDIGAELEPLGDGFARVRRRDRWTLVRGGQAMLDSHVSLDMAGNKPLTARLLGDAGFAQLAHERFGLRSIDRALAFLAAQPGAVVVKPASGTGAGRGVTCGIETPGELRAAARLARRYGRDLLVEPHVPGASFRLLYVGGELVCAVRRDPPRVVGDGRSALVELCAAATRARLAAEIDDAVALHPLDLDLDARLSLARRGLAPAVVLGTGEAIAVKHVVNQNAAPDNHVVIDEVHPSVAERGADIVRYLGLDLAGVDVMAPDLVRPVDRDVVMAEVNTSPGLHHHVLVAEPHRRRPVYARTLELALERAPRRARRGYAA